MEDEVKREGSEVEESREEAPVLPNISVNISSSPITPSSLTAGHSMDVMRM